MPAEDVTVDEDFEEESAVEPDPLPELKADLVALAIDRKVLPSYEAWDKTVPELKNLLES